MAAATRATALARWLDEDRIPADEAFGAWGPYDPSRESSARLRSTPQR
jgi:hypothetical protein